jgi:hypothetical protein
LIPEPCGKGTPLVQEDGGILKFEFSDPVNLKTNDIVMTKYEDVRAKALMNYGMLKLVAYLTRR